MKYLECISNRVCLCLYMPFSLSFQETHASSGCYCLCFILKLSFYFRVKHKQESLTLYKSRMIISIGTKLNKLEGQTNINKCRMIAHKPSTLDIDILIYVLDLNINMHEA